MIPIPIITPNFSGGSGPNNNDPNISNLVAMIAPIIVIVSVWLVAGAVDGDSDATFGHAGTSRGARIVQLAPTYWLAHWLGGPAGK